MLFLHSWPFLPYIGSLSLPLTPASPRNTLMIWEKELGLTFFSVRAAAHMHSLCCALSTLLSFPGPATRGEASGAPVLPGTR